MLMFIQWFKRLVLLMLWENCIRNLLILDPLVHLLLISYSSEVALPLHTTEMQNVPQHSSIGDYDRR